MGREKKERCNRTIREEIPGLLSELYCGEPAVWKDLGNGCHYCEKCIRFVSHGILKRIERKERKKSRKNEMSYQKIKKLTLGDYAKMIIGKNCVLCHKGFTLPIILEYYPRQNGWNVTGFIESQWLYVVCSNKKCRHQNSLEALGIKH